MSYNYQSLQTVLAEINKVYSYDDEVKKTNIISWANDAVGEFNDTNICDARVIPLKVDNYFANLPLGFMSEIQCLYTKDRDKPINRLEAIEWTQKKWGTDCKYVITKECGVCHASAPCECGLAPIIMVPDHLWQKNHGTQAYGTTAYVGEFTMGDSYLNYPIERNNPLGILPYSTNNFHTINHDTNDDCQYPNLSQRDEYLIQGGKILTSFKKGSLLFSYTSELLDEKGLRLIPDHPFAYNAVISYVMERIAYSNYSLLQNPQSRTFWMDSLSLREKDMNRAIGFFKIPSSARFDAIMKNKWNKFTPNNSARYNLDRYKPDEHQPKKL